MSRTIDSVTISSIEDRRLVLGNSQAARVLSIGSNWDQIRIGMRFSIGGSSDIAGNPRLMLGLMVAPDAGLTNGPLGGSCPHFVGAFTNMSTMAYAAGPPANYTLPTNSGFNFIKRVGFTNTTVAGVGISYITATTTTGPFTGWFLDITKGSPNYTVGLTRPSVLDTTHLTQEVFIRAAAMRPNAGAATGYLQGAGMSYREDLVSTLAVNEGTNGALTTLVVAWDRTSPLAYISDLTWCRFS